MRKHGPSVRVRRAGQHFQARYRETRPWQATLFALAPRCQAKTTRALCRSSPARRRCFACLLIGGESVARAIHIAPKGRAQRAANARTTLAPKSHVAEAQTLLMVPGGPPSASASGTSRCLRLFRSAQRLQPKLHGQGPRAEADAARRLPRLTRSRRERTAAGVPPRL